MPKEQTSVPVSVIVPADVDERLRVVAGRRGIPPSAAILEAIDGWLRKHERKEREPQPWHLPLVSAVEELLVWQRSVHLQLDRILENLDAIEVRRMADVQLMVLALRQVLRFAELCRDVAPESARAPISFALESFKSTSPHVKNLRDVLDHHDAYLRGTGLAFPAGPEGQEYRFEGQGMDHAGLRIFRPITSWTETRGDNLLFFVGLAPSTKAVGGKGTVLVLDVARDAQAALTLCLAIREATLRWL